MSRWRKVALGGALTYLAATGSVYLYFRARPSPEQPATTTSSSEPVSSAARHAAFRDNASSYDRAIGMDETMMGLPLARRALLWGVRGRVLEVGCGTGRNLKYYRTGQVEQVVGTDNCAEMLEVARGKASAMAAGAGAKFSFQLAAAEQLGSALGDTSGFDAVVDTFGLCSYDDPVAALRAMAQQCRPGGRLYLLQHGRGHYEFINNILDRGAQQHAAKWGCFWNRDILELVRQAGLRVVSAHRLHFGTTYWLICEPADGEANAARK